MPTARSYITSHVVGGKIYVVGGDAPGALATVEVYDPISDTWENGPSLYTARLKHAGAVYNGTIFVFGGINDSGIIKNVEKMTSEY